MKLIKDLLHLDYSNTDVAYPFDRPSLLVYSVIVSTLVIRQCAIYLLSRSGLPRSSLPTIGTSLALRLITLV